MGIVSPKDSLTRKERKAAAARLAGKSLREVGEIAYPKAKQPKSNAAQALGRPRVQKAMTEALKEAGATPEKIAKIVSEGLDATHRDFEGNEHPDHNVRHKFVDTSIKVYGGYAPDKHMNVNASGDLEQILDAMEKRNAQS